MGKLDTMIFSVAWADGGVGLPVPGTVVVYLVRVEGAESFLPGTSARPTPRRLLGFLAGFGREAMIFEGETMSHFTSRTSGKETNIVESFIHGNN
jgi:hypothetical protein